MKENTFTTVTQLQVHVTPRSLRLKKTKDKNIFRKIRQNTRASRKVIA